MALVFLFVTLFCGYCAAQENQANKNIGSVIEDWRSNSLIERNASTLMVLNMLDRLGKPDIDLLKEAQEDDDLEVSMRASQVLDAFDFMGKIGPEIYKKYIGAELFSAVLYETEENKFLDLIQLLSASKNASHLKRCIPLFIKFLRSRFPEVRKTALTSICNIDPRNHLTEIILALMDNDEGVKSTATQALRNIQTEECISSFIRNRDAFLKESNPNIPIKLQSVELIKDIKKMKDEGNSRLKECAQQALLILAPYEK